MSNGGKSWMQQQRWLLIVLKEERWGTRSGGRRDGYVGSRDGSVMEEGRTVLVETESHSSRQWLRRKEAGTRLGRGQPDETKQQQLQEEMKYGTECKGPTRRDAAATTTTRRDEIEN
jgi:hypothetical protein